MPYLLAQIFLCLLAAFLLGLLIGWLIFRNRCRDRMADLEDELESRRRRADADGEELRALQLRVAELEAGGASAAAATATSSAAAAAASSAAETAGRTQGATSSATAPAGRSYVAGAAASAPAASAGSGERLRPLAAGIPAATGEPDDLQKIWGIGPRMESLLNGDGITTFAQLAGAPVDRLRAVIVGWGSKRLSDLANEETWPEQASMAARGDWAALKEYQGQLSWRRGGGKPS